jgi:hypothetical protein
VDLIKKSLLVLDEFDQTIFNAEAPEEIMELFMGSKYLLGFTGSPLDPIHC